MPRSIATTPTRANRHTIAVTGDSLSGDFSRQVPAQLYWPEQLASSLRASSPACLVKARDFARPGNTTGPYSGSSINADMISRLGRMTTYDTPDIAVLWGGYNDASINGIGGIGGTTELAVTPTAVTDTTHFTVSASDATALQGVQASSNMAYVRGVATQWSISGTTVTLTTVVTGLTTSDIFHVQLRLQAQSGSTTGSLLVPTGTGQYFTTGPIAVGNQVGSVTAAGGGDTLSISGFSQAPSTSDFIAQQMRFSVASVTSATVFTLQTGQGRYLKTGQGVAVGSQWGTVSAISGDQITLASALPFTPSINDVVTQGTQANVQRMVQVLAAAGVTKIVLINSHYLNWSTSGDTTAAPYARQGIIRPQIYAASVASYTNNPTITYVNLYSYMRGLIVAGTPVTYNGVSYPMVQGNANWHFADGDVHLNAFGHFLVARYIQSALPNSWITALQS